MDKTQLKELKKIANELKPMFNLGKGGLSETFIETIDNYLQAHEIVKIKVLSAENKDQVAQIANDLGKKVDAEVLDKKGFTFVLYRNN